MSKVPILVLAAALQNLTGMDMATMVTMTLTSLYLCWDISLSPSSSSLRGTHLTGMGLLAEEREVAMEAPLSPFQNRLGTTTLRSAHNSQRDGAGIGASKRTGRKSDGDR